MWAACVTDNKYTCSCIKYRQENDRLKLKDRWRVGRGVIYVWSNIFVFPSDSMQKVWACWSLTFSRIWFFLMTFLNDKCNAANAEGSHGNGKKSHWQSYHCGRCRGRRQWCPCKIVVTPGEVSRCCWYTCHWIHQWPWPSPPTGEAQCGSDCAAANYLCEIL